MDDLIERLRAVRIGAGWGDPLCIEAADRITSLQQALEAMVEAFEADNGEVARRLAMKDARAALSLRGEG